jgi:hypothetical protein
MLRLFLPAAGLLRSFAGRDTSACSVTASARLLLLLGGCMSMLLPLLHVLGLLRCRELGVARLL